MNFQAVEETIKADYREASPRYREDDEIEVTTPHHERVSGILRNLCHSFPHPIRVLDVGCGTGRFFHAIRNACLLVGLDVTREMLSAAENPVRSDDITVPEIRLLCGNAYLMEFPRGSFDFIYSLGMFGNGCPVTVEICNRFHRWLAPGGKLFFNTIDVGGLPRSYRVRRFLRDLIYSLLPGTWRKWLNERESRHPFFALSRRQLERILAATHFSRFSVRSHVCQSPLWEGRHLECLAQKLPE